MNTKIKTILDKLKYYYLYALKKTPDQIWAKTLESLLKGVDEKDIYLYKTVLNNQRHHCQQMMSWPSNRDCMTEQFMSDTIVLTRSILDKLTIKQLVGFQPMRGPVGLVYYLKYTTSDAERRKMMLEVVEGTVEAGARKFKAGWTIAAMHDLKEFHGLDIKYEMMTAFANELADEITHEWISRMNKVAFDVKHKIKNNEDILVCINHAANEIGRKSRRGTGNWIVVSLSMLERIKNGAGDLFVPSSEIDVMRSLLFAGTLNDTIKVYVAGDVSDNDILVGYKGGSSETDCGLIYSPYVMLMPSGPVMDPNTFEPLMTWMTRYGAFNNPGGFDDDDEEKSASSYYCNLRLKFK